MTSVGLKKKLCWTISLVSALGFQPIRAQLAPNHYLVEFTDKLNSPFSVTSPSEFLSARAIDRRVTQNIPILIEDLPVNPAYIQSINALNGARVKYALKWFNAAVVELADTNLRAAIQSLPHVIDVSSGKKLGYKKYGSSEDKLAINFADKKGTVAYVQSLYGAAEDQLGLINLPNLHNDGFYGKGIQIGVMDAGFAGLDTLKAFDSLFSNNQILGGWDFVDGSPISYNKHSHGMAVMSFLGANVPNELMGAAPASEYYLYRTENAGTELLLEEYNWVAAAEAADSAGVDLLTTSLGYTTFDDSLQNHTYLDLDGNTTPMARGANIAASKGMLVVNSAGNYGNNPWFHIGTPADAHGVLAVGATEVNGSIAEFSSRGPASDGAIKPNVSAAGAAVASWWYGDSIRYVYGTSFSGPTVAGAAACLWQSEPNQPARNIFEAIERSAHLYHSPNADYGYGIPNFESANAILAGLPERKGDDALVFFPNPTQTVTTVSWNPVLGSPMFFIYDINGRQVFQELATPESNTLELTQFEALSPGVYHVKIRFDAVSIVRSVVKY